MEFVEFIATQQLDNVGLVSPPLCEPVLVTLCITGHHLILSARKEEVQELMVGCITVLIDQID